MQIRAKVTFKIVVDAEDSNDANNVIRDAVLSLRQEVADYNGYHKIDIKANTLDITDIKRIN